MAKGHGGNLCNRKIRGGWATADIFGFVNILCKGGFPSAYISAENGVLMWPYL